MRKQTRDLKLKQIRSSMKAKRMIPIESLGARLKDIREVLGMTQKQLAKRLKVKQPLIARIEKNTRSCSVSTLSRIANALECELMCSLVSKQPLGEIINKRAQVVAKKMLDRTFSSMALEKQSPGTEAYKFQLKKLTVELAANPGPALWED
jgi:predicted DNA-binding mobile mystery protein A